MPSAALTKPSIVYAGPLSGTCLSRFNALLEMEPQAAAFDIRRYRFDGPAFFERLDRALTFLGEPFRRSNADFLAFCEKEKPDIVWVDKGFWLWPSTVASLRRRGVFLVQHNTDKLRPANFTAFASYRLMRRSLPAYHLYFTSNLIDHAALLRAPNPPVELTHLGYDSERFNASPLSAEQAAAWANDLIFIGHHEPRTEAGILALLDAGLNVSVFGYGWQRAKNRERLARGVHFETIKDEVYAPALKGAKIGIGFVSQWNGNETAGRSFEIPACGTFLLAQRTRQHLECYAEGEEAEFFDSPEELVAKAKRYLADDARRRDIATRGHARCVGSDYSWRRYMRDDWRKTLARYQSFKADGGR